MKSTIAIASLTAASAITASSSAAILFYNNYADWLTQVNGASGITTAGGAAYSSDWSGSYAPVNSAGTVTYGGGWQTMQAVSSGPALTVSGTNIDVNNSTNFMQQVTFSFLANGFSAPHAPVAPNGMYAWGFDFSGFSGTALSLVVNGNLVNIGNLSGLGSTGFIGVVSDYAGGTGIRLDTVTVWVGVNDGFSITGNQFASVPAPGALALLGVAAATVRGRRRS